MRTSLTVGINPKVLKWAREKAGYSLDEIARLLGKDIDDVKNWEMGDSAPTYSQLEKMAQIYYKRPIALFFFPTIPEEPDTKQSFRTLPDFEIENLLPDSLFAIRLGMKMQISLRELYDGANSGHKLIFRDIVLSPKSDVLYSTKVVREYFGIPINEQKEWRAPDIAFKKWRETVQNAGVFIFKRSFKQDDVSGFCLSDNEFPIIYINNSTSINRQIFTIIHELAHILLNTNGLTKKDDGYINSLAGDSKDIEVFCNQFAAEFLVPSKDFEEQLRMYTDIDLAINSLHKQYGVSREVILRRLLDKGIVSGYFYQTKIAEWNEEYEKYRQEKSGGGGNYYATNSTYLGEKYINTAFSRYYQGRCSLEQLADFLNVKVKSLPGLEPRIVGQS